MELGLTLPPQTRAVPRSEAFKLGEFGAHMPGVSEFGHGHDDDGVPDPELSVDDFNAILLFVESLGVPERQVTDPPLEALGEDVFDSIGSGACHVKALPKNDGGIVEAYTDLLLHEVLPEDQYGISESMAGMREFRPLRYGGPQDRHMDA